MKQLPETHALRAGQVPNGEVAGAHVTTTSLSCAQAQLVEALTRFQQLGMGDNPKAYLRKNPKPLNKSQSEIATLAAVAALEAAEAVDRLAWEKFPLAKAAFYELVGVMMYAKRIQALMLEVVRTLMRPSTSADSPVVIATLVFKAKSLAGMFTAPHRRPPSDGGSDTQALPDQYNMRQCPGSYVN